MKIPFEAETLLKAQLITWSEKLEVCFHVLCVVFKYWIGSQQKAGVE